MQVLEGKPKIDYPTKWEYRVIGQDRERIKEAIIGAIQKIEASRKEGADSVQKDFEMKDGQVSSGGKFVSVVLSVEVESECQRDEIFVALKESPEVNMVL